MSTIFSKNKICAVCGANHNYHVLGSTNAFGSCDLDLRPPEMKRSTMVFWVEECPSCGYVWSDISTVASVMSFISSEAFSCTDGKPFTSRLASKFYKKFMLCKEYKDFAGAFYALLHVAWDCDDQRDIENAKRCRKLALEYLDILISEQENNENLSLQKADIMRRSGEFDAVIEQFSDKVYSNELLNKIIHFRIEKSKLRDDGCYTVADV